MTSNNQFDYQSLMALFDPAKMAKQFETALSNSPLAGMDTAGLMASQKKTMEAMMNANQSAVSGAQQLFQRQAEMLQQAMTETQETMKQMSDTEPTEAAAKNAENLEKGLKQAMENFEEIAGMMQSTYQEVTQQVEQRMQENVQELQDVLAKSK